MSLKDEIVTNYTIYKERANSLSTHIENARNIRLAAGDIRYEIINCIEKITFNIDFVYNKLNEISTNYLQLAKQLLIDVNISIINFLGNQSNETNLAYLAKRLTDIAERSVIIQIGIAASLDDEYRVQQKEFRQKSQLEIAEINELKESLKIELNSLRNTVERYKIDNVTDLEKLELNTNVIDFEKVAEKYNLQSERWRIWIVFLVFSLIGMSFWFLYCINVLDLITVDGIITNENKNVLFYFVLFKNASLRIFIIGILVYLLKFCVNNYNAAKHNWSVNRHKANCLQAAMRIISLSPKEDEVRKSIFILAGREIFTQQVTGYLDKREVGDLDLASKILSMAPKSGQ